MELKIEYLPIKALIPYEKNTRKHQKKDVDNIARSIEKFGMNDPIGIWKDNIIVEGHGRLLACKQLGMTEVPCVRLDHLTDEQRREYAIAHNATAELSEWDLDILPDELAELNLSDFDFDFGIDGKEENEIVEDEAPEVDEENDPISKPGDIWLLGRHRLMCGDSTDKATVEMLMDGKKANLVVTDPPYNVNYEGTAGKIKNDNMDNDSFYRFLFDSFTNMEYAMADDASIYVFHSDTEGLNFRKAFADAGFYLSGCCIWKKPSLVLGRSPYQWQHEPCLFGWKKSGKHKWYAGRKETTIWEFDKPKKNSDHPTMKPIALISYPIKNSSMSNCIVLDPFGGSGSTLIACEQLDRICYTMELDPKYCDVILQRYINMNGTSEDVYRLNADGTKTKYADAKRQCL